MRWAQRVVEAGRAPRWRAAVVFGRVSMGDGAIVGAQAVVSHDVAPGQVVAGVPARPVAEPDDGPVPS